jgi:hypothetical protein
MRGRVSERFVTKIIHPQWLDKSEPQRLKPDFMGFGRHS